MNSLIRYFNSADEITDLINKYFAEIGINSNLLPRVPKNKLLQYKSPKKTQINMVNAELAAMKHDPPTLSGLALYLGFQNIEDFEIYTVRGRYAYYAKVARLIIISYYEKKLHGTYTSGAIYALKSIGWYPEKIGDKSLNQLQTTTKIEMIESGPSLAENEKEVSI
jgi:hypothetical protein